MIIEGLLNLIIDFLKFIFSAVELPDLPSEVTELLDEFMKVIESGLGILNLFIDWDLLLLLIPVVLIITNFEVIWSLIMFIVRKIPFLGME